MAKILVDHFFHGITPDEFWALLWSKEFDAALEPALGVKFRKELERTEDENSIHRRVRVVPGFPVPAPVQKLFAGEELEYLEESTFHKKSKTMDWDTKPNLFPGKVVARGQVVVTPQGDGVRRVIQGDITVSIFGVGGIIERAVLDSVRKSYENAAVLTREWIHNGRHRAKADA